MLRAARKQAKLSVPSVTTLQLRDLRRTGATRALANKDVRLEDVQAQLRHLTRRMTEQVYTHPSIDSASRAVINSWELDENVVSTS